ncbi:TetR/AcrR family transcriptional regulator [Micromonospora rubida]|uniref:TetR/AcrR family transcriptional regulator n=1 Tax=Micromonospora rubida TaxID=2697657 RepID=UPI001377A718|nr:TetR/AcrR family transcriptional regulator [Micromonospora rubida]NBE79656.1 TetR family transcriptional regulator [Micromonospora rubida]
MTSEQQHATTPAVPPARTAAASARTSPTPAVPAARTAPAPARAERFPELLATVIHLLREVGYDRLTIDTVAARARVSKATIYRHWPGKPELVAAALHERHVDRRIPADTGSLRGDLLEMLRVTAAICTADSDLIQALTLAMRTAPELEKLIRHQVMPAGRVLSAAVVVRAAARGEIPPEAGERDLFHDLAPAMVMSRILAHGLPADDTFLTELVDQVLIPVLRYRAD